MAFSCAVSASRQNLLSSGRFHGTSPVIWMRFAISLNAKFWKSGSLLRISTSLKTLFSSTLLLGIYLNFSLQSSPSSKSISASAFFSSAASTLTLSRLIAKSHIAWKLFFSSSSPNLCTRTRSKEFRERPQAGSDAWKECANFSSKICTPAEESAGI